MWDDIILMIEIQNRSYISNLGSKIDSEIT